MVSEEIQHFIFSWALWGATLNLTLIFIIRPKFIFSPRRPKQMEAEKSLVWQGLFVGALFLSACLLGSATYFMKLNNATIVLP